MVSISIDQKLNLNNSNNNLKRKFSVEKLLEAKEDSAKKLKTSTNIANKKLLKFGVESFILKDKNESESKLDLNCEIIGSQSPNPCSLLSTSRSQSQCDNYYIQPYLQPSYVWTSATCEGCVPVMNKSIVSNESCYYPIMTMNRASTTYAAQQMFAGINGLSNTITDGIYNSNNLYQSHYNSHCTPTSGRSTDPNVTQAGKRKKSWSRAVFSNLQRKGLENRFKIQKYITKPDRRTLAATLGLTDSQVKVWFQNRRMKWRHSKEYKEDLSKSSTDKDLNSSQNKSQETIIEN